MWPPNEESDNGYYRATMGYYIGLDVSLQQTSICVVDQSGVIV
jgi:hypothetical protein